MRFFLLLLTINTFLFGAFICLPVASPFLKKTWEDYQARREEKRMLAATEEKQNRDAVEARGLIDACMKYSAPAEEVVYAEAPGDVEKLLAVAGRAYLVDGSVPSEGGGGGGGGGGGLFGASGDGRYGGILLHGNVRREDRAVAVANALERVAWQPPAARKIPDALVAIMSASRDSAIKQVHAENAVFLHEMTTPSGQRRLVWVAFSNQPDGLQSPANQESRHFDIAMGRRLDAYVFDPDGAHVIRTSMLIQVPVADLVLLIADQADGKVTLEKHGQWRIFTGQADKTDRSHFTIAYEIDGRPGVIDGRLTDGDRLMLEPRVGRLVGWKSGEEYTWEMPAAAGPATRAVK